MPQCSFVLLNDILKRIEYWITVDDWINEYQCNNYYFPGTTFLDVLWWNEQDWVLRVKPYPESHYSN